DDPVIKLEAELKVEDEVLPRTAALMSTLANIDQFTQHMRKQENDNLERSSVQLRALIFGLAGIIIVIGLFFSVYMSRIIIKPINIISSIVNDLGKGIIRKTNEQINADEMGVMILSVNNLS